MEHEVHPHAPFNTWAPQWVNPAAGFVWIAERPAAIVTQSVEAHVTPAAVEWLHDVFDELVADGFVTGHPGLILLHDWRSAASIDALARKTFARRSGMRKDDPFKCVSVAYIALSTSPIVRMTITAAGLAMQVATGQPPIRVIEDPTTALDAHRIRAPGPEFMKRVKTMVPPRMRHSH